MERYIRYFKKLTNEDKEFFSSQTHEMKEHSVLLYIEKGKGWFFISSRRVVVTENMLVVIPSQVIHSGLSSDDPQFCAFVCLIHKDAPFLQEFPTFSHDMGECATIVKEMLELGYQMYHKGSAHWNPIMESLSESFLSLLRAIDRTSNKKDLFEDQDEIISEITQYINQHYTEEINLDILEERLKYSKFYLAHQFKQKTGISIHQYIDKCRRGRVEQLLITETYSVREIAEMMGFSSTTYFNNWFKNYYDMTPSEYRQEMRIYVSKDATSN